MSVGIIGSYNGIAKAETNLIPIFRENEIMKNPNSFLNTSALIVKKLAILAPKDTEFTINGADFLMTSKYFELGLGVVDITELSFKIYAEVNITYIY